MSPLAGYLELGCGIDSLQESYLRRQSFKAPFYINKPYHDRGVLMVQMINPTPGLFSEDRLRCTIEVDAGARLALSSPSACRVHAMPNGHAESFQNFKVAAGGWLEFTAAPLIPQAHSRLRQRTTIEIATGGEMFFQEVLTPGRVARGEIFAFAELDWELELRCAGDLVVRERYRLREDGVGRDVLRHDFPAAYYASILLVSDRVLEIKTGWLAIESLNSEDLRIGITRLLKSGWSIKMLARDSVTLRRALQECRSILAAWWPDLNADIRRL